MTTPNVQGEVLIEYAPKREGLRRSVPLPKGFSQMDWSRIASQAQQRMQPRTRPMTWTEVERHNNISSDAWMVLRGRVYDITNYVPYHPGGKDELARAVGDDGTNLFDEIHSYVSESMLDHLAIGYISDGKANNAERPLKAKVGRVRLAPIVKPAASTQDTPATSPAVTTPPQVDYEWKTCKIASREILRDNRCCYLLRLQCDDFKTNESLKMPGCVVKLQFSENHKVVERPFTPFLKESLETVSFAGCPAAEDEVVLLVKAYEDGVMTKYLATCNLGITIRYQIRVPVWQIRIQDEALQLRMVGAGGFRKHVDSHIRNVCLIAGGTGIMPGLQLLAFILEIQKKHPQAKLPKVSILFANHSDVILNQQITSFKNTHSNLLVEYKCFISGKPKHDVPHTKGRITAPALQAHIQSTFSCSPAPVGTTEEDPVMRFLICGSNAFNRDISAMLVELGWSPAISYIL